YQGRQADRQAHGGRENQLSDSDQRRRTTGLGSENRPVLSFNTGSERRRRHGHARGGRENQSGDRSAHGGVAPGRPLPARRPHPRSPQRSAAGLQRDL